MDLPEVLHRRDEVHQHLLDYLEDIPEEQFTRETRFRRRLKWDSFGHYPLHTGDILKWRKGRDDMIFKEGGSTEGITGRKRGESMNACQ
jgi:hypothetical protein